MLDLLAFKAKEVPALNISNKTINPVNGSGVWVGDEYIYTVTTFSTSARIEPRSVRPTIGNKYYFRGDIFPKYASQTHLRIGLSPYTSITTIPNTWNTLSNVIQAIDEDYFRFYHSTNNEYVAGDQIRFKNIFIIDLTKTFGAGNEPTKEQLEKLLDQFPNRFFEGAKNLFNAKHFMNMYFKKMKELENAITALGGGS